MDHLRSVGGGWLGAGKEIPGDVGRNPERVKFAAAAERIRP